MSGMGPASCWVTHKRLESWARAAKERALGSTSPKRQENGSNSNSSNNSLEVFCLRCLRHLRGVGYMGGVGVIWWMVVKPIPSQWRHTRSGIACLDGRYFLSVLVRYLLQIVPEGKANVNREFISLLLSANVYSQEEITQHPHFYLIPLTFWFFYSFFFKYCKAATQKPIQFITLESHVFSINLSQNGTRLFWFNINQIKCHATRNYKTQTLHTIYINKTPLN